MSINGQRCPWPIDVVNLWLPAITPKLAPNEKVTAANYFTPRPYRNEYDRGSDDYGFVYTLNGRHVCLIRWTSGEWPKP